MDTQDTTTETEAAAPAEFPKMLYRGGNAYAETGRGVPHQDTRVVNDADEEAEAREEGFSDAQLSEGGSDTVEAGEGDDTLTGGAGNDSIGGEDGAETVEGQAGADSVEGATGSDSVAGASGSDTVDGGAA